MVRLVVLVALLRREARWASVAWIVAFLAACSTTHVVGQPLTVEAVEQLNVEVLHNRVVVDYAVGGTAQAPAGRAPRPSPAGPERIVSAENVLAGASLDWLTFGTQFDGYQRIASSRVRSIRINDPGRGAINGLFYGLLSGVAAGVLVGFIVGSGRCTQSGYGNYATTKCPSKSGSMTSLGIAGGLSGSLVGVLAGAFAGYRTTFVF